MELHFSVLAAWSISQSSGIRQDPPSSDDPSKTDKERLDKERLGRATDAERLVDVMREIADKDVIGQPSNDEDLNIKVVADHDRLTELLKVFKDSREQAKTRRPRSSETASVGVDPHSFSSSQLDDGLSANLLSTEAYNLFLQDMTKWTTTQTGRFLDEQTTEDASRLIDLFREAVQLAKNYCDVQRAALLNKLSRAYQKPDFCVRRDSVGALRDVLLPMRDEVLPITVSWDEDWYHGRTLTDDEERKLARNRRRKRSTMNKGSSRRYRPR
jgi:hypothetical protein